MIQQRVTGSKDQRVNGFIAAWGWVFFLTLAVFALRVLYLQLWHPYGLAPDEAQYWSWLSHNDWSFLTKPPLTTWLMGVSSWVLGDTLLGVKFFALVGQAAVSVVGFAIANEIAGRKAGWWAWALLTTLPLVAAGGLIMCPDAILLPLWMAALLSVVRGLGKRDDKALCWGRWVSIGVLIGLAGLAKYTAALFYPLLFGYALLWRREWVVRPQIYVSGLIALAFQLPVLIWNFQHDWVGVAHVLWQADGGDDARHGGMKSFGEFAGGQVLVLGPVVFGLMLWALGKGWQDARQRWLVWVSGVILGAFALLAFTAKVQANWPLLGAVTGVVVLACWLGTRNKERGTRWVMWLAVAGVVLNAVLSLMLMDTYKARDLGLLPLKAKNDPTKDLRGWEDMGMLVSAMMGRLDRPVILSSRYQTLAPLMFHANGSAEFAYVNAEGKRMNQYDLWPLPPLDGRIVVYVNEQGYLPQKVRGMFGSCEPWHTVAVEEYGMQVRRMSLWVCWGAHSAG